jgi:hypothetical protein
VVSAAPGDNDTHGRAAALQRRRVSFWVDNLQNGRCSRIITGLFGAPRSNGERAPILAAIGSSCSYLQKSSQQGEWQ